MSVLAAARPLVSPYPLRAALYCRISDDKRKDSGGVERQERTGRRLCADRGYVLDERHVYIDNSRSAWKRDRNRPGWDALMAAVAAGEIDVIVCVDADRLMRQPRDLEDLIDATERTGIRVEGTVSGYDLTDPNARANLRGAVVHACKESDNTSRRVRAFQAEKAAAGEYGGGRRRYGFEPGGLVVREAEAAVIRELAARRLRGTGWHSLRDWANEAGHRTAEGHLWTTASVKKLLGRPYIAGLLQHQGKVVGAGNWPAIIDEGTFQAMAELGEERASRWHASAPTHRFYELRGVLVCACGTRMTGRVATRSGGRMVPEYVCSTKSRGGCGTTVMAAPVERLVGMFVQARLAVTDLHAGRQPDPAEADARDAEVTTLLARKNDLAALYGQGEITMDEWKAARGPVETRLRDLRRPAARRPTTAAEGITGPEAAARWDELDPPRRNAIIRTFIEAVIVSPAQRRGGPFDPARLDLRPRHSV